MTNVDELDVVFGAGAIGLAVADELAASGARVRVVHRSGQATLPAGVEAVAGDASDRPSWRAREGASVVYQCLNPPYHQWAELFPPLQEAVLGGAAAAEAKLVSMENVYMYGSTGGAPITEDVPYAATTRKGRVRAQMAEQWEAAHRAGKVRATAGRASDFFGPRGRISAMGERVFDRALAGKTAEVLGDPDQPHTYSYLSDIARGLVILGARDEALGQAWHLPSAETRTTCAFVQAVFEQAGTDPKLRTLPKAMMPLIGLFNRPVQEMREMLYEFEEPFILDDSKFEKAFGPIATPLPEAISATLDWYRDEQQSSS